MRKLIVASLIAAGIFAGSGMANAGVGDNSAFNGDGASLDDYSEFEDAGLGTKDRMVSYLAEIQAGMHNN